MDLKDRALVGMVEMESGAGVCGAGCPGHFVSAHPSIKWDMRGSCYPNLMGPK